MNGLGRFHVLHSGLRGARGAAIGFRPLDGRVRGARRAAPVFADRGDETFVVPRLEDEVARAAPHCLDGQVDGPPGGHDDDGEGRVQGSRIGEQVETLFARGDVAGVVEVDEDGVESALPDRSHDISRRTRRLRSHPLDLEQQPRRGDDPGLIVGDEHSRSIRLG